MFSNISCFTALNKTKVFYIIKRKYRIRQVEVGIVICDPTLRGEGGEAGVLGVRNWAQGRRKGGTENKAPLWSGSDVSGFNPAEASQRAISV